MKNLCKIILYIILTLSFQLLSKEQFLFKKTAFNIENWNVDINSSLSNSICNNRNIISNYNFLKNNNITSKVYSTFIEQYMHYCLAFGIDNINNQYSLKIKSELSFYLFGFSLRLGTVNRFHFLNDLSFVKLLNIVQDGSINYKLSNNIIKKLRDFLLFLKHISYKEKNKKFIIKFSKTSVININYNKLVNNFVTNVNVNQNDIFNIIKLNFNFLKIKTFIGPILYPTQFGFSIYIHPAVKCINFKLPNIDRIVLSYVCDNNSPFSLKRDGDLLALNKLAKLESNNASIHGFSISSYINIFKSKTLHLILYGDCTKLICFKLTDQVLSINNNIFSSFGYSLGFLNLYYLKNKTNNIYNNNILINVEARIFESQYLPNFFDTFYEIEKYQFRLISEKDQKKIPTKIGYLCSLNKQSYKLGYCIKTSYYFQNLFKIKILYETAFNIFTIKEDPIFKTFNFDIELADIKFAQLLISYKFKHFKKLSQFFNFNNNNELFILCCRIKILPFLYFNIWTQYGFKNNFHIDDYSSRTLPGKSHGEKFIFSNINIKSIWLFGTDIEVILEI